MFFIKHLFKTSTVNFFRSTPTWPQPIPPPPGFWLTTPLSLILVHVSRHDFTKCLSIETRKYYQDVLPWSTIQARTQPFFWGGSKSWKSFEEGGSRIFEGSAPRKEAWNILKRENLELRGQADPSNALCERDWYKVCGDVQTSPAGA